MFIHVLQSGETLLGLSAKYKISTTRIIEENDLSHPYETISGQSLWFRYPHRFYTVKGGDTIDSICKSERVTLRNLQLSNPWIASKARLFPGQIVATSSEEKSFGAFCICGFLKANDTLKEEILPFLTTLTLDGIPLGEVNEGKRNIIPKEDMPALLLGIQIEKLVSFLEAEKDGECKLIARLKNQHFSGIDIELSPFPQAYGVKLQKLHKALANEGMPMWCHAKEGADEDAWLSPLMQEATFDAILFRNSKNKYSLTEQIQASTEACLLEKNSRIFPSLPCFGYQVTTSANEEQKEAWIPLKEILLPAHKYGRSILRDPKTNLAYYSYSTGAGRYRKRQEVYFEDPLSFSFAMSEMNRKEIGGICVNAGNPHLVFLWMIASKWHIIQGNMR